MDIDQYEERANDTNLMGENHLYFILALLAEVREVAQYIRVDDPAIQGLLRNLDTVGSDADNVAKLMRNRGAWYDYTIDSSNTALLKELGDCAWPLFMLARACGFRSSDVLSTNLEKLADRKLRGTIASSGDNR